ncbi:MAG: hypothetical protein JOZ83_02610 [Silvibacterium sp.]|nr:hypothetical protein [Silvibacterium sp.]
MSAGARAFFEPRFGFDFSRVRVTIDELVLRGFEPADHRALVEGLQAELSAVLSDHSARAAWARPHRTPVLKLGGMQFEPGATGSRRFGANLARTIGKGLKP